MAKVKRTAFEGALKMLEAGTGQQGGELEGLHTITFDGNWAKTYNNFISVAFPIKSGIKGAVPFDKLLNFVKLAGEDLEISIKDDKFFITDGKGRLKHAFVESKVNEYAMKNLVLEEAKWKPLPASFIPTVRTCSFSSAADKSQGVLYGLYINGDEVMTTDRFRATLCHLDKPMNLSGTVLDMDAVKNFVQVAAFMPFTHYAFSGGFFHLKTKEEAMFSSRALIGNFPCDVVRKVFTKELNKKYTLPEKLGTLLETASIMAGGSGVETNKAAAKLQFVDLYRKGNKLVAKGETVLGESEQEMDLGKAAADFPSGFVISVTPQFLEDVLHFTNAFYYEGTQVFFITDALKHVIITKPITKSK